MPKMKMSIPHDLGQEEARERVQGMISNMKEQYGDKVSDLHEEWNGDTGRFSLKAMGMNLKGTLKITDSSLEVDGTIATCRSVRVIAPTGSPGGAIGVLSRHDVAI